MKAEIIKALRSPKGVNLLARWAVVVAGTVALGVFHVPRRWLPDGAPWWVSFAILCAAGVPLGWIAGKVGGEAKRWAALRDEYAAAQRDVERLERGDR